MAEVRNLIKERWLRVAERALVCARRPELPCSDLHSGAEALGAGAPGDLASENLVLVSLKWLCKAFALSQPPRRLALAPALIAVAKEAIVILEPEAPPPSEAAAAVATPPLRPYRADIDG